jgi:hypothetical protein
MIKYPMLSPRDFIDCITKALSEKANQNRTLLANYSAGFSPGPGRGIVTINFINLPPSRHQQRRGGGAESENNRQLFMIWGFNENIDSPVSKIKIEQSINGIYSADNQAPKMRAKTGDPAKIAIYAEYINRILVEEFVPKFTHN